MHIEFPGKTVIVTGGGHGFGRAIAHAFAARGAATWTCDINPEPLRVTKAEAKPAAASRSGRSTSPRPRRSPASSRRSWRRAAASTCW
jgi:NAD(P)-dependent dehydrogenase (short-subunit alcohol dehydrogenase family)